MEIKRAISPDQLLKKKFKTMKFDGAFAASIGDEVEYSGSWIIYGLSGHGKTTFTLQLSKYLTKFGRVAYDSIEEGARLTFQIALRRQKLTTVQKRKIMILSEPIEHVRIRLKRQKSPDFIIIDSIQFSMITRKEFNALIAEFPTKLFIWLSHAEGKKPKGNLAEYAEFHADVKIHVLGFKALIKSRYGGIEDFIINEERAATYWNDII